MTIRLSCMGHMGHPDGFMGGPLAYVLLASSGLAEAAAEGSVGAGGGALGGAA